VPATAIAVALGGAELVLRALDRDPITHYQYDQQRGWSLRPGYAGWYDDENHVWVQINSDGLRDREHAIDAAPRTVRVAILGDSYVEAMNLPFEQSVVPLLEQRLGGCLAGARRQAEVINFAVGGYGTGQQLLTYRHHVLKYRPDVVLLAVYTSNDILDNSPALDYRPGGTRPYFGLSGEVLVAPDWPPADDAPTGLPFYQRWRLAVTDRSYVANVAWSGWSALRATIAGRQTMPVVESSDRPSDEELTRAMLHPPRTEALQDAWRVTETLFAALAGEVRNNGSEFWMTTLSTAEQVHPDLEVRGALAKALDVQTLYYPDDRISAFAASHDIPTVSLVRPLADYAAAHHAFLHGGFNAKFPAGTGHWNDTAHRLAASIIGDRLCRESRALSAR
jgi:hypothetical protein